MYASVQSFINCSNGNDYHQLYEDTKALLFNLLDSPVKFTQHIGGTTFFLSHRTDFRCFSWSQQSP